LNKATPVKALQPERALNDATPEYNSSPTAAGCNNVFTSTPQHPVDPD
jgi:hypothetical protein